MGEDFAYLHNRPIDYASVGADRIEIQVVVEIVLLPANLENDEAMPPRVHGLVRRSMYLPSGIQVLTTSDVASIEGRLETLLDVVDGNGA